MSNKILWIGTACLVTSVIFGANINIAFSQFPPPQSQLQKLSCPYGYYLAQNRLCYLIQSQPTNGTQSPLIQSTPTNGTQLPPPQNQLQTTANVNSIMGLNAQNIQNYEFNLGRITDIAKLHNATNATLDTFANQRQVLTCVQLYFSQSEIADCNDLLTGYLTQNELGNNQTMINIAKAYLVLYASSDTHDYNTFF